jgi:hypothetical protein
MPDDYYIINYRNPHFNDNQDFEEVKEIKTEVKLSFICPIDRRQKFSDFRYDVFDAGQEFYDLIGRAWSAVYVLNY